MTSPLEMLEEMKNRSYSYIERDRWHTTFLKEDADKLISFAIAVLAMEERKHHDTDSFNVELNKGGYNQALAEVHQLAEKGMK